MIKLLLLLSFLFLGCSERAKVTKTWLSVESPPTRVILLADDDIVNQELICKVIRNTKIGKYHNYPFNNSISLSATGSATRSTTNTNTDSKSLSVSTP